MRKEHALEGVGLAGALIWAGVLRLGWPGVHPFSYDEARVSLLALQMVREGKFVSIGIPSSSPIPNFPAFVWIMALPYALSTDPLVASLWVGAVGVLTVVGVWLLARRAWGAWAGLAAAWLMAGSPFGVLYARSIWSQNIMAPIALLWALAGVWAIRRRSGPALALHMFLAGFAGQVHYSGVVLLLGTLWLALRCHLWRGWPWLVAGGGGAILAAMPFLYRFVLPAWERILAMREGLQTSAHFDVAILRRWAEIGLGAHWEWLPLGEGWHWPTAFDWAQWAARAATGFLLIVGIVSAFARRPARASEPAMARVMANLLPAWALAPIVGFLYTAVPVYHHYLLTALPALVLVAASAARPWKGRAWGPCVAGLAVAISLIQGAAVGVSISENARRLIPGGWGTPLKFPRAAVAAARNGLPVYVHAWSDDVAFDGDAAEMSVLLWGYPHRILDGRSALLLPPSGQMAHLFCLAPDVPACEQALSDGHVLEKRELPRREGEPPYIMLTVVGGNPEGFRAMPPIALANGAQLQGWKAQRDGNRLQLITWWHIIGPVDGRRYHQFNHLYTMTDEVPFQVRDAPAASEAWQVGNTLITWATFEPEVPGPYWAQVGMYSWPEIERVPLAGATGGNPPTGIWLGPFD